MSFCHMLAGALLVEVDELFEAASLGIEEGNFAECFDAI